MRYIKTFEEITKVTGKCDRCGETSNQFQCSIFNEEMICPTCFESEKDEPDYTLAKERESEEVRKGNYNYKGLWNEFIGDDSYLHDIAQTFLEELSKIYDLRLNKPFDKEKANCSWFTKEFTKWCNINSIPYEVVYFDSETEAHIATLVNNKIIDFTIKQFTKNPKDNYKLTIMSDYKKFGYPEYEILDEVPDWVTIRKADKL